MNEHLRTVALRCATGLAAFFVVCAVLPLWSSSLCAAREPSRASAVPSIEEYRLKAAFIYNFAKFAQWRDSSRNRDGALVLCVANDNHFLEAFASLGEKAVNGRPLHARQCTDPENLAQAHMLFVNTGDPLVAQELLSAVQGRPVLTIGELQGFTSMGGMINFYRKANKVRFEVNVNALRSSPVELSSHVLKLARIVEE